MCGGMRVFCLFVCFLRRRRGWGRSSVPAMDIVSVQFSFSSRCHRSARKGPYALRPVSQQSPQGYPRNTANICLVEHRSFSTLEGGVSAAPFPHSSFLTQIDTVFGDRTVGRGLLFSELALCCLLMLLVPGKTSFLCSPREYNHLLFNM